MNNFVTETSKEFDSLINEIPHIGFKRHAGNLIKHAEQNFPFIKKSIKNLPPIEKDKLKSGIIIGAGPSLHNRDPIQKILNSHYKGTIVAIDGSYAACIRAGLIPDFVLTLDPHTTRVVRWFGDHEFEKNTAHDDYFARQDLDIDFRKNSLAHNNETIKLVNKYGHLTKAIIATSAPANVVQRIREAKFDMYWWNPLVDNPNDVNSITMKLYEFNKLPCMNTGGTVGTASWVFASTRLNLKNIALVGMDYGYYVTTPITQTQTYYELLEKVGDPKEVEKYFIQSRFPLTGEKFYADPTYFWYRKNFLELLRKVPPTTNTFNCTEAGTLVDNHLMCVTLDEFLKNYSG